MSKIIRENLFDGQVVRLTLNSPKANILDAAMMFEILSELDNIDQTVKLIQFSGKGEHFSFGASVQEHTREKASGMLDQFHRIFKKIIDLGTPTAALVSGQCLGGGFELALMCNFLFVDQTARCGQPEIHLGVFAPPASVILPAKIGQVRSDELLITGRTVNSEYLTTTGLATGQFESQEDLIAGVSKWTKKNILPKSSSSLKFAVRAARHQFNRNVGSSLDQLKNMYVSELMESADANEGIHSFLEKRHPVWENR